MLTSNFNSGDRLPHDQWNEAAGKLNSISDAASDRLLKKNTTDDFVVNSIISDDGANAYVDGALFVKNQIIVGQQGDGTSGNVRLRNDAGVVKYLFGFLGNAGATSFNIFDIPRGIVLLNIDGTTGIVSLSAPVIAGTPIAPNHLTTKEYVDGRKANANPNPTNPDASDLASAIALVNELKAVINSLQDEMRVAGLLTQ